MHGAGKVNQNDLIFLYFFISLVPFTRTLISLDGRRMRNIFLPSTPVYQSVYYGEQAVSGWT